MVKEIVIILVAGFVVFEIIEQVVFPLVWLIIRRRRGSRCDVSSMIGKMGEVKQRQDLEGKIFVNGEIWTAKSDVSLLHGDKAIIEGMDGFVLSKRCPTFAIQNKRVRLIYASIDWAMALAVKALKRKGKKE